MIDNYDSFTWNLVQYLQVLGAEVTAHLVMVEESGALFSVKWVQGPARLPGN